MERAPRDKSEDATALCAEVDHMLRRHHEQLVHHLDLWMIQLEQTVCGGAWKPPAFPPAQDPSPPPSPSPTKLTPSIDGGFHQEQLRGAPAVKKGSVLSVSGLKKGWERNRRRTTVAGKLLELKRPASTNEAPTDPHAWYGLFVRAVQSFAFELCFAAAIVFNAAYVGVQTQYAASHPGDPAPVGFTLVQYGFTLLFLVELLLRLAAYRWKFFSSAHWQWNWFDVFLVCFSLLDVGLDVVQMVDSESLNPEPAQGKSSMRMLRLVRVTRLIRALRIVRILRFVADLRSLILTIIRTLKSLVWSLSLLCILFYCFGILFTQASTDYIAFDVGPGTPDLGTECPPHDDTCAVLRYFGGLGRSMFTLFKSVTGGISWSEAADPLGRVGWPWVALFVVYIAFTVFAVLNVVTSKFCQSAIDSSLHDHVALVQSHVANKEAYLKILREVFRDLDSDGSGTITLAEFQENLDRDEMKAYLDSLGLSSSDALVLFSLLDADGTQTIDIEEFMMGCLRLRGTAKSIDLASLMSDQKALGRRVSGITELVRALSEEQHRVLAYVKGLSQRQAPCAFPGFDHSRTHVL